MDVIDLQDYFRGPSATVLAGEPVASENLESSGFPQ
jgi:hypothetical protein